MPFLCLSDPWVSVKLHNKQHSSENAQVQVIHQKWIKNQVMAKKKLWKTFRHPTAQEPFENIIGNSGSLEAKYKEMMSGFCTVFGPGCVWTEYYWDFWAIPSIIYFPLKYIFDFLESKVNFVINLQFVVTDFKGKVWHGIYFCINNHATPYYQNIEWNIFC